MKSVPLSCPAHQEASQVAVLHICRGVGLVQFILGLGCIMLLLMGLLPTAEQHGLELPLAGFETIHVSMILTSSSVRASQMSELISLS